MTSWQNIEIDQVRRAWMLQFGGAYPDDMIEAYLGFVESMAGTASFAMQLLKRAHDEIESGGIISQSTKTAIETLINRDYMKVQAQIKAAFQELFKEESGD